MNTNKNSRILTITLCIIFVIGYTYNYDWPESLETVIMQEPYNISPSKINIIYVVTGFSGVLFSMKLGMVLDKLDYHISLIGAPLIVLICQIVFGICLMFYSNWIYYLILLFRFIYGLFGQCLFILQSIVITYIFKKGVQDIIGYGEIFAILLQPLNSLLTPFIYSATSQVYWTIFIGAVVILMSLFSGIYFVYVLDKNKRQKQQKQQLINPGNDAIQSQTQILEQTPTLLQKIKSFGKCFWILQLLIFLNYSLVNSFVSISMDYFVKRFKIPYSESGLLAVIPYTTTCLFALLMNIYIKKHSNHRTKIFVLGNMTLLLSHLLFVIKNSSQSAGINQYVLIVVNLLLLGFGNGVTVMLITPSISMITKQQETGAAYGAAGTVINLSFMVLPLIGSLIIPLRPMIQQGYRDYSIVFLVTAILSLIVSIYIHKSKQQDFLKFNNKQVEQQQSQQAY